MELDNKRVLLDGLSYAIIEVDTKFAGRLAELKKQPTSDFGQYIVDKEILNLVSNRVLSKEDQKVTAKPALKTLILAITDACNLRCKYCFERGVCSKKSVMSKQIAEKSIQYLMEHSPYNSVHVRFFGGEPLLNIKLIKYAVNFGRVLAIKHKKEISFSIVTNGTLITEEIADFFKQNCINVQVSIDGCKESHDANRVFPDGAGSFDVISKSIEKLKERGLGFYALTVAGKHVLRTGSSWLSEIDSLSNGNFDFVFVADKRGSIKPNAKELRKGLNFYKKYLSSNSDLPAVTKVLNNIKKGYKCCYGCNAGLAELVVTPSGDINFCERLTGNTQHNIAENISPDKLWQNYSKSVNDSGCKECWAKYLCGGGCAHTSMLFTKAKRPVWWECEKKKLEIEAAIRNEGLRWQHKSIKLDERSK